MLVPLFFSYWQKLKLEKEVLISIAKAIIQLIVVVYVLQYVFSYNSPIFTTLLLLFMVFNASLNAAKI